ncbi:MAG: hypothetical protein R2752_19125 [Vicinamibacterales bacterium]
MDEVVDRRATAHRRPLRRSRSPSAWPSAGSAASSAAFRIAGTYGLATALPWGVDFGDGVARHPTQIYYEAVALAALALGLARLQRKPHVEGDVFRVFLVAYLAQACRDDRAGRTAGGRPDRIQWAAVGGLLYYVPDIRRWMRSPR